MKTLATPALLAAFASMAACATPSLELGPEATGPRAAEGRPWVLGDGTRVASTIRPSGTRRAVVVGINTYERAHWPGASKLPRPVGRAVGDVGDLDGAVNDADSMVELLVARFGFARENILVLRDLDATREGILGAIGAWLVEPAKKDDTLVFYYSGHGSLIQNPAEVDRSDETLVPADSAVGALDVRDDELAKLWNELVFDREAKLTVILDSCHSGGMSRGITGPGRSKRVAPAIQPLEAIPLGERRADTSGRAVFLSASQDFQEAKEAGGKPVFGAFTRALLDALREDAALEVGQLLQRVQARLIGEGYAQRPDIRGGRSSGRDLVGDAVQTRPVIFPVSVQRRSSDPEKDGRVELLGGSALGLTVGSRLAAWDGAAPAADWELEVTRVELGRAIARQRTPKPEVLKPGTPFVVTEWMPGPNPLRVAIESGPPRAELDKVVREAGILGAAGDITLVAEGEPADFHAWFEAGAWQLEADVGSGARRALGSGLTAASVRAALLAAGAPQGQTIRLALALPPARELAVKVREQVGRSGGVVVTARGEARYVLVGEVAGGAAGLVLV
jgi:uncharacterized caspase-like protein